MSTSSNEQNEMSLGALDWFSGALVLALLVGAVLFFGFGIDLMSHVELGIPCLVRAITGIECPGCGMTRALILVSQLEWGAALRMNALVILLLGIAAWMLARAALPRPLAVGTATRLPGWLALPALGVTLAHWLHRVAI